MINKHCYILDADGNPVSVDLTTWGRWMESEPDSRVVARTQVSDSVEVSTVFLGLDHRFFGEGRPILWETMIFGGAHDGYQQRYETREEAMLGHEVAVLLAKATAA